LLLPGVGARVRGGAAFHSPLPRDEGGLLRPPRVGRDSFGGGRSKLVFNVLGGVGAPQLTCTADHLLPAAVVIPHSLSAAAVRFAENASISAKMGRISHPLWSR
jgi:hypothetical protein